MNCPTHPAIELPDKLTCPLCAQEARQRAYAQQRAEMARQLQWAVQGLLRPATGQEERAASPAASDGDATPHD